MIQQLVQRILLANPALNQQTAAAIVLGSDPLDLVLHMEQVWDAFDPWAPNGLPAGPARRLLWGLGAFGLFAPPAGIPAFDHLGYSWALEQTRAVQILRRVIREFRSGEGLGIPSVATQRWLDATETLLFGAANPISAWLSTSAVRQDAEGVRRNAYWRLFGLDLSFGTDDNRPAAYDKANAANTSFVRLFEELLFELWQAIINVQNRVGVNTSDNDRIFRIAEELRFVLRSRRQQQMLGREELAATTVLGWVELTLSADTPVVVDLRAQATSAADRLRLIGERVGLAPHSRSAAFFSMCSELSIFLRTIESGVVTTPDLAWILYLEPAAAPPPPPTPVGVESRRVITEWAAATGKDLKARGKPIEVSRPRLVTAR
ncbi:hypothetical protein [Bradyrhizobium sp. CCGE-LA001]|uniref:hypothetical protein n=1 Tax=Bradyrhizobium sp. CCGE-LA001 TaxID=1223566 RepID=UPI0002AA7ACE|nr:hypothetical protein [Bradyrhizobium sp. CCGE-LA001]AMA59929.1 hypothetical protein BCCGELA001_29225 [Bradyrhizobium sp. CCGE-LA001]